MSDAQLADTVRGDEVDVLVDVVGHMAGNRLPVFARKPAPVQITGWGEPTGTGLAAMDYLLADKMLVPESERALLAEQVIHLPNFLGYWVPDPLPPAGPLPAAERGYVTFGSFNRIEKLSYETLSVWAELLRKLDTARLILKDRALENAGQKERITKVFAERGISSERLTLLAESDRSAHFAAYQEIDIALDPFPHSGGMTTLDALWMGVPVITFPGETISSRLAASSLSNLGLDSFIARDLYGYVDLALEKARDIQALSELRPRLRGLVAASEFGDPARYSRAVEAAYRGAWRQWCAAKSR
jgi:predicted O-linked N-acetylglucosamine transferase (SPINDLY family)